MFNEYIRRAIKAAMDKPELASEIQKRYDKFWSRQKHKNKEDTIKFAGERYANAIDQQILQESFAQVAESLGYKRNELELFIKDQGIDPDTMTPGRESVPGETKGNDTGATYGTETTDARDAKIAREQYGFKGEVFDNKNVKSSEDAFLERQQQKRDEEARDAQNDVRPGSQYNKDRTPPVDPDSAEAGASAAERGNKPYRGKEDSRPEDMEGPTEAANTDETPVDADRTGKVPTERAPAGGMPQRNIEAMQAYLEDRGIRLQVSAPQQPVNGQLVEFKTDAAILNNGRTQQTVILENAEPSFGSPRSGATGSVLDGEIYLPKFENLGNEADTAVGDLRYNDTRGVLVIPAYGWSNADGSGPERVFKRYLFEMNADGPTPLIPIDDSDWQKIAHRYHEKPSSNENSAFAVELNRSLNRYIDEGGDPNALDSTVADDSRQARIDRVNQAIFDEEGYAAILDWKKLRDEGKLQFGQARPLEDGKDLLWYEDNDQVYKLEPIQLGEFLAQGSLFNSGGMESRTLMNEMFRDILPSKQEVSGITQYRGTNTRGFVDSRHDLAGGRRLPTEEEALAAASDLARYTLQRENPLNPIYDQLEILRTGEATRAPDTLRSGQPRRYYRKTNPDGSTTFEPVPAPEDNEPMGFTSIGGGGAGGGGPAGALGDLLKEKFEQIPNPPDSEIGKRPFNDTVIPGDIIEEGGFNALAEKLREIAGNEDAANIFEGLDDVTTRSFKDVVAGEGLSEDDIRVRQFYDRAKLHRIDRDQNRSVRGRVGEFFQKPSPGRDTGEPFADPIALLQTYLDRKAELQRREKRFLQAYPEVQASPYNNRYISDLRAEIDQIDEILGYDPVEFRQGQYDPNDINRGNETRTLDPLYNYDGLSRGMVMRLEKELDGLTTRGDIMALIEKYKAELKSGKYNTEFQIPTIDGMAMSADRMASGLSDDGLAVEKMVDYLENTLLGEADNMLQRKIDGLRGQQQSYLGDISRLTNELVEQGVAPPEWVSKAIQMQLDDLENYYDDVSARSIDAEQLRMAGDEETMRADQLKNQLAGIKREIRKLKELQFSLDNEDLRKFNAVKAVDNPFPTNAFPVLQRYLAGAAEEVAEQQYPNWSTMSIEEKAEKIKLIQESFGDTELGDQRTGAWDRLAAFLEQGFREEGLLTEGQDFDAYDTLFHRTDIFPGYTHTSDRSYFSPRIQTTGSSELAQANRYIKSEFEKAGVVPPMWLRASSANSQQGMGVNRELLAQIQDAEALAGNPNNPDGSPKTAAQWQRDIRARDQLIEKSNTYKDNMSAAHQQYVENARAGGEDAAQYSIVGDNGGFYAPMIGTEEDPTAFIVWNRILEQNPEALKRFSGKRDAADGLKEILFANYLKNMPAGGDVNIQNGYMKILADQQYAISKKLELQDALNRYPNYNDEYGISSPRSAAIDNTLKQIEELNAIIEKIDLRKREFLESIDSSGEIISAYDQIETDIAEKMGRYVEQPQGPQQTVSNFNDVEQSLKQDLANATDPATRQQLTTYMESVRQELNNLWGEDPTGQKTRTVTTTPEMPDPTGKGFMGRLENWWGQATGKYAPQTTEEPILPNVTSVDEINRRRQQILANLPAGISAETVSLIEKNLEELTQVVTDRDRALGSIIDRRQPFTTQPAPDIPLKPEEPGGMREGLPKAFKGNFGRYYVRGDDPNYAMDPAMQNISMYFDPNKYAELRGILQGRLNQADLDFATRATPEAAELARYSVPELERMMADTLAELPPEAHVNMTFEGATAAKRKPDDPKYVSENVNEGAVDDTPIDDIEIDDLTDEQQFEQETQAAWGDQPGAEGVNRDTPANMLQRAIIKTQKDIETVQQIVDTGRIPQRAFTMNPEQAAAELERLQGLLATLESSRFQVSNLQQVIDFKKGKRGRPLVFRPEDMNVGVGINRQDETGLPGLFANMRQTVDFDGEVTGGADESRKITKNFFFPQDFKGKMPTNGEQFLEVKYEKGVPRLLYYPDGFQGKVIDVKLENLYRPELSAAEVDAMRTQGTHDVNQGLRNYALKNSPSISDTLLQSAKRDLEVKNLAEELAYKPGIDANAQRNTAQQANRNDGQATLGEQPRGNPNKVSNPTADFGEKEGAGADSSITAIRREQLRQGSPVKQEPLYTESRLSKMFTPKIRELTDNPVRNLGNLMYDNPGYTAAAMTLTGLGSVAALRAMAAQRRAEEAQQQQQQQQQQPPPPPVQPEPEPEQPTEFNWRKQQPNTEFNWRRK